MKIVKNPYRRTGLPDGVIKTAGNVRTDPAAVQHLLSRCPVAGETKLRNESALAQKLGIGSLFVKDERNRMGLGSFKALGAAFAIAKKAHEKLDEDLFDAENAASALNGEVFTAATAGNHGMSIAAGARVFGARAVIFIAETVPEAFAGKLETLGAEVVRAGADYEASLIAAKTAAEENGWTLLSDTSWPGYSELPLDVMEGYLAMASETADRLDADGVTPSHVVLQAGVGGLAAAVAAHLRVRWGNDPVMIVVEPDYAPSLQASIEAGRPVVSPGPVSNMGRLDCKEPSQLALKLLAREADYFMTVSDGYVSESLEDLAAAGLETSPSGGAGYAGLKALKAAEECDLGSESEILMFISEGPTDD